MVSRCSPWVFPWIFHMPWFQVGQLTAVSECDLCCVEPVKFGHIVALIRWAADGGPDGARGCQGPTWVSTRHIN